MKEKLIRVSTIPASLSGLLTGQLKFMSNYFEVIGVSSKGNNNQLNFLKEQEGIRVESVEMSRNIDPLNDLISIYRLYKLFKREKPYIVHSITPKAGLLSMIAAYFAKVPHRLHTFTGLIFPTKKGLLQKILIFTDRLLCFCATNIYPEGQGVKNDLKNFNITSKALKIIANGNVNGINLNYFDPNLYNQTYKKELKEKLSINEHDFVFISLGRLVSDKGINELVATFQKLNTLYPNTKLLLVGDYETELDPLNKATLKHIEENVNIINTGWVKDVRPYFAISDILTFPSYREGFPNVVLQAGAMGLPSIVTDISGSNEIIIEGENGTIIPVKDTETLYNKMLAFYEKTIPVNSETCRALIASRYQQQVVWSALLEEYNALKN